MYWYSIHACTIVQYDLHVAPSPRGDLEILGYCLLLWSASTLPWDHYVQDHDQERVAQMKIRYIVFVHEKYVCASTKEREIVNDDTARERGERKKLYVLCIHV